EEVANPGEDRLGRAHQLLEAHRVPALLRNAGEESEDVLLRDEPYQLRQLPAGEGVRVAEEELVELRLLEGADDRRRVADEVEVEGRLEGLLGPFENPRIESVARGLVDQQPVADRPLDLPVEPAGAPPL